MNNYTYQSIAQEIADNNATLVAVSKTRTVAELMNVYKMGQRVFGENRPKELRDKATQLPDDIEWHMIGHLQRKNIKYLINHVHLIHSVDSIELLDEINKRASQANRIIGILLQLHIAQEESKFGFLPSVFLQTCESIQSLQYSHIEIRGLMGMATNTKHEQQIKAEFQILNDLFDEVKHLFGKEFTLKSMGMSGDYKIALQCGSNMVRIGSLIFNSL